MDLHWTLHSCIVPVTIQGVQITLPLIATSIFIRLCVTWGGLSSVVVNSLATVLGVGTLWMFYDTGVVYFILLSLLVYVFLNGVTKHKGVIITIICIAFLTIWSGRNHYSVVHTLRLCALSNYNVSDFSRFKISTNCNTFINLSHLVYSIQIARH